MKRLISLAVLVSALTSLKAQTPCENGMAGNYPCQNVTLLGHLSTDDLLAEEEGGVLLNDIWGWTDPDTNKEYAIVGMANGTSFVDISDPTNPIMLGMLPEHHVAESTSTSGARGGNSVWRDVKVYENHAFIVSEDAGHGMQVFDLTNLRDLGTPETPLTFSEAGHYDGISNAHNIVINEATGFAYAVGANGSSTCGSGGLHIINIQNPTNPVYEACFDNDGYTHDAQCVIYNGPDADYQGLEICFNSNADAVTFVNVDDKENISLISSTGYSGTGYTHQGWVTEDHRYFISNDELDERNGLTDKTKTFIWDIQDLDNPELIHVYDHTTESIDHNLYIVGDMMYQSNYTTGLRVFDVSQVSKGFIRESGYFDTYPANDGVSFFGTWSNYPFFDSGVIAVSDITNGLFLLEVDYSSSYVVHELEDFEGCTEKEIYLGFEVAGEGVSYQWQYDLGSGFEDISDLETYSDVDSNVLTINEGNTDLDGLQFRCIATDGDIEYVSEVSTLSIEEQPIADFNFDANGRDVQFTNTSILAESYQWDFGDGSSGSIIASPVHEYPNTSETYQVILSATNNCGTKTATKSVALVVTDVDDRQAQALVYPNPGVSFIQIRSGQVGEQLNYRIFNSKGQQVLSGQVVSGHQNVVDAKRLFPGMYVVEIEDSLGKRSRQKLVMK